MYKLTTLHKPVDPSIRLRKWKDKNVKINSEEGPSPSKDFSAFTNKAAVTVI